MKIIEVLSKKFSGETLLKHNAPAKAKWLTYWPTIKADKNRTQIVLPVAPIILGVLVSVIFTVWYFWQYKTLNIFKNSTSDANILTTIGKVIELPDETPQVAIVSDVSLLDQPFFSQAENGDYVIVYQQSGKVLLYRPSVKKVINFANIQIPTSETDVFMQNQ